MGERFAKPAGTSTWRLLASLLALATAIVAYTSSTDADASPQTAAGDASRASTPRVSVKAAGVRPGKKVRVVVTGFPSRERVRVQFGLYFDPPQNCCASKPFPRIGKPGLRTTRKGRLDRRIRMPKRYAQCVSVSCSSPNWQPYKAGQKVFIGVNGTRSGAFARDLKRVRGGVPKGKRRPQITVKPARIERGARIRVSGRGWKSRKRIGLGIGPPRSEAFPVGNARTNRRGRFDKKIGPIKVGPGRYVVVACRPARTCRKKAKDSFRVIPRRTR